MLFRGTTFLHSFTMLGLNETLIFECVSFTIYMLLQVLIYSYYFFWQHFLFASQPILHCIVDNAFFISFNLVFQPPHILPVFLLFGSFSSMVDGCSVLLVLTQRRSFFFCQFLLDDGYFSTSLFFIPHNI